MTVYAKVIRGWCSSTRKRRKRIARRKIDGKSWLGDCIVLFLVRKQYLTIPFGDLNSYNGRQGEKEGGKSVTRLDELTNLARIDVIESRSVPSRIFFQSSLFELSSTNFSPEYFLHGINAYVFRIEVRIIYLFFDISVEFLFR